MHSRMLKLLLTCKDTTACPLHFATVDYPFTIVVYLLIIHLTYPWTLEYDHYINFVYHIKLRTLKMPVQ